jgi:hypothetical protein
MNILPPGLSIFLNFLSIFESMERRLKNNLLPGLILVLAGLCLGTAKLEAATFTASLDRDTIALGETASLSLTFEGSQPNGTPQITEIPGLQIRYVGPSSQFNFINGQTSTTITFHFTVTANRPGEYTIPALTARVDGQPLTCQPLRLVVTPPNAPPATPANAASQVAFMKLSLPKEKVYVGEVVTARLELYLRQDVQNFGGLQVSALPTDGFTTSQLTEGQRHRVQIGNTIFTVVPYLFTLTARKSGPLSVGPVTGSVVVVLPSSGRGDPFFEQFGIRSSLFGGGEQKQVALAAEPLNTESLPLPAENVPANFNGAIGRYSMAVSAGPTNVAVGDPITVRIQISGRGALDALMLPAQPAWRDFKAYPPTQSLKTAPESLGLQGTKTFEQIVAPQSPDLRELPSFSFSYFDPEAGAYRTLTEPPVQLAVHSAGAAPAPVIAALQSPGAQTPPPRDILPIKEQLGALESAGPALLTRPTFLTVQSLPVLAWLAVFVWRKRTDALANNPRLRRQRQVARLIRDGFAELHRLASENKSDEFFAALFRLLQEQLGERLDCPASSITEAVIDERLAGLGAPEATLAGLRELFQLCNQARYAPLRSSGELAAVIPRFEDAVRGLQEVKG